MQSTSDFFFRALNLYFVVDIWNCSMNVEVNRHEFVPFLDLLALKIENRCYCCQEGLTLGTTKKKFIIFDQFLN